MRVAHQWVLAQIYDAVVAAGYEDLGRAHVGLFRYPTTDGLRPTELAERIHVTKQSVNDVLRDMEDLGYLVRVPDPTDGRARVVRLTEKGRRLEDVIHEGAHSAESTIAEFLGVRRFTHFRASLEEIANAIAQGSLNTAPKISRASSGGRNR
jgi:DNA-binding MarR family transcriptional regulator